MIKPLAPEGSKTTILSSSAVAIEKNHSFNKDSWEHLKEQGYLFMYTPKFTKAFKELQEEISNGNFDKKVPAISLFEGFKSEEDFSTHQSALRRDSWYLSPRYPGPFEPLKVKSVFDAARPIWTSVLGMLVEENLGFNYMSSETIGFHRYSKSTEGIGLAEHKDSGIVTILASTHGLEGFIDNKWQPIIIPENHVMVFIGSICELMNEDFHPLLHRVSHVNDVKISLGIFIDPAGTDPLNVNGIPSGKTVADYHAAYFSLNRNAYPNFLKSVGRHPQFSY